MSNPPDKQMRFMTTYSVETDEVTAYPEGTDMSTIKRAIDCASDWVWQFADNEQQAISQHFTKLDEWEINPDKDTY